MRGERRQHFETTYSEHTLVSSRLLSETATDGKRTITAKPLESGKATHQPGLASDQDYGGCIRLVRCIGVRPGTTVQGFKGHFEFISQATYGVHGPPPIFVSGAFLIKASQLPDAYTQVFSDLTRGEDDTLPYSNTPFSSQCFRNIVNDRFATAEHLITSESSKETQALLPELVQTMEVVGDDELNLTYDEWVYLVTGWYPKNNKSMSLGTRARRATLGWATLIQEADATAPVNVYGKWVARHNFGWAKNLICVEPSFICFIAGVWETPNSESIYTSDIQRYQAATANDGTLGSKENVLDRGAGHTVDQFRHSEAWLADPSSEDALGGMSSPARASMNYWLNGEVAFTRDYDPTVLTATGEGKDANLVATTEATEGNESFISDCNFFVGMSTLQHFPDA